MFNIAFLLHAFPRFFFVIAPYPPIFCVTDEEREKMLKLLFVCLFASVYRFLTTASPRMPVHRRSSEKKERENLNMTTQYIF